jgi:3-hydroxyacyl-[acyl-carrier-protein] dehydratase
MSLPTPIELLDTAAVHALLAHRYPFLLVDRIAVIEPARHVIGTKRITAGEWWNEDPANRLLDFPFSLVIEALAQTSGALIRDLAAESRGAVAYFMGVNHVRLRSAARPGDELTLDVRMRQWRRGICRTHGIATVGDRLVASADLTTVIRGAA